MPASNVQHSKAKRTPMCATDAAPQQPPVEHIEGRVVHPPSYQPGTVGFVERRQQPRRRADDHMPTVDTDALAEALEHDVSEQLSKLVHRTVQAAIRRAVGKTAPVQQPEKVEPVVRNGVRCPDYGTVQGSLWLLFAKAGAGVTLSQAKQLAKDAGLNEVTASIALYNWRKFHGVKSPAKG